MEKVYRYTPRSHMYILFLPRVGLYVSFLPLDNARGKTSWHKGLPVVKTIYTYGFHELFLKFMSTMHNQMQLNLSYVTFQWNIEIGSHKTGGH